MTTRTTIPRDLSSMIRTKVAEVQSELPSRFQAPPAGRLAPYQLADLTNRYPAFARLAELLAIAETLRDGR